MMFCTITTSPMSLDISSRPELRVSRLEEDMDAHFCDTART